MVARNHDGTDPGAHARGDCRRRFGARPVGHRHEAQPGQRRFELLGVGGPRRSHRPPVARLRARGALPGQSPRWLARHGASRPGRVARPARRGPRTNEQRSSRTSGAPLTKAVRPSRPAGRPSSASDHHRTGRRRRAATPFRGRRCSAQPCRLRRRVPFRRIANDHPGVTVAHEGGIAGEHRR